MISINFSVYGGSCWDNSGKANAMAQAKAGKAEAMAIIKGLTLHEKQQESSSPQARPSWNPVRKRKRKKRNTRSPSTPRVSPNRSDHRRDARDIQGGIDRRQAGGRTAIPF